MSALKCRSARESNGAHEPGRNGSVLCMEEKCCAFVILQVLLVIIRFWDAVGYGSTAGRASMATPVPPSDETGPAPGSVYQLPQ